MPSYLCLQRPGGESKTSTRKAVYSRVLKNLSRTASIISYENKNGNLAATTPENDSGSYLGL